MTARVDSIRLGLAGALLALAACSGDTNLVRDVAVATGVGAEPKPAPDFVAASRPETIDYTPIGLAKRSAAAKTPEQVKAAEDAMDQARTANESQAAAARDLSAKTGPSLPPGRNP